MRRALTPTMSRIYLLTITSLILFLQITLNNALSSHIILSRPRTNILAEIGEELHITCKAIRCDEPKFTWASLMDNTLSGTVHTEGRNSTLTMKVNTESDGSYRCAVSCNKPPGEKSFKIIVYSFPSDPILHISSAVVGEQSRITCTFLNVYRSDMMTALILLDAERVTSYIGAEMGGSQHQIKNITLYHDLILQDKNDGKKIECVGYLEFEEDGIEPIKGFTTMDLNLMYPPVKPEIAIYPSTTVRAGDKVTLTCSSESGSQVIIQWMKLIDGKESEMSFDAHGSLILPRAEPEDSGVYICYAKNNIGNTSSHVEISVQDPPIKPQIRYYPSTTVRAGDKVTLTCSSESGSQVIFQWMKLIDGKESEMSSDAQGSLILPRAEPEDSGVYICYAKNNIGNTSSHVEISVQVPPKTTYLTITPSPVVKEGDDVHIKCSSEAFPAPTLVLFIGTEHGLIELESENGQYNISHAGVEHTGMYICESRNIAGQQVAEINMTVNVFPRSTYISILPSPVVTEGDSVQITCTSEASPAPRLALKMRTEHGLIELESDNGQYNITNAKIEHAGTYLCESANILGQQVTENTLVVQIPHRNTTVVVTPSQNITEGDTVTITCETHSIPSPTMILQKVCARNSTVLQTSNGTITLYNVTRNDTGTYTLNIISSGGNETEVISIIVAERQQSPRMNYIPTLIIASIALVSAGIMIGVIIHRLKQSKAKGSYSLVKALRSKV